MSDVYTVNGSALTVIANGTVAILRTAAAITTRASVLEVLSVRVGQTGTTTSQMLGIQLGLKASAFGTYTAATPAPNLVNGNASGLTGSTSAAAASAGIAASVEGAGTFTPIVQDSFNVLSGWLWVPVPEERIRVSIDTAFAVKLLGTPGTLTGWSVSCTFKETN